MLIEVLNEDLIETNAEMKTRDEAVRESGRLLCSQGFAEERYIDAMIQNVKENGTYIVIAPGIAMPHARLNAVRTRSDQPYDIKGAGRIRPQGQ